MAALKVTLQTAAYHQLSSPDDPEGTCSPGLSDTGKSAGK